jgi:hypothetical protein
LLLIAIVLSASVDFFLVTLPLALLALPLGGFVSNKLVHFNFPMILWRKTRNPDHETGALNFHYQCGKDTGPIARLAPVPEVDKAFCAHRQRVVLRSLLNVWNVGVTPKGLVGFIQISRNVVPKPQEPTIDASRHRAYSLGGIRPPGDREEYAADRRASRAG